MKKFFKYKICWIIIFIFGGNLSFGQVIVKIIPPVKTVLNINDILNFYTINSGSAQNQIIITGEISDKGNKLLAAIKSAPMNLKSGISYFYSSSLNVTSTLYYDNNFRNQVDAMGDLPNAQYQLCIKLIFVSTQQLAADCEIIGGGSIPPRLIAPSDKDNVDSSFVNFSWLPPEPSNGMENIVYHIKLTEILPGQSPEEALHYNPIWFKATMTNNNYLYPQDAPLLKTTSRYAWQVDAWKNDLFLGESQIYDFGFRKLNRKEIPKIVSPCFAIIKPRIDAGYYSALRKVYFSLEHVTCSHNFKVMLTDNQGKDITPNGIAIKKESGSKNYSIDLSSFKQFINENMYTLTIHSTEGETYMLKFKYARTKSSSK
jgi:hypothetical protein